MLRTCIFSSSPWVIDTSATNHVASVSTSFSSRQSLGKPSCVSIADGSTIEITGLGSDPVTSSFTLDFILHVPHFSFNLISLSKLIKSLNCSITFFPHGFMF